MIFDLLTNSALYSGSNPRLALGFDWLKRMSPSTPDGRIEIDGDRVFALVQSYQTGPAVDRKFETHRDHIDIQYIISGTEIMQCAPVGELKLTMPYDPARDAAFYADPATCTSVVCGPGVFTVFFTHDGHRAGCLLTAPAPIKKVVVKVHV